METLSLPAYEFRTRIHDGRTQIYDAVRRKYVRLTPEEWVRQHLVRFMLRERGVPAGLVAVEHAFTYQGMTRRADVVVHDRQGQPLLMAECKAPGVPVTQDTFDQVARYNKVVRAPYLVVTNGRLHYCCRIDHAEGRYHFEDGLPRYDDLARG